MTQNCWGSSAAQSIETAGANGFKVTRADHNKSGVAAYPSLYHGQWPDGDYQCGTALPRKVSSLSRFTATARTSNPPSKGNVAWDLWFSKTNKGHGALELMVWLRGNVSPIGSKVASISGWDVWRNSSPSVVSYVRQTSTDSVDDLDLLALIRDAVSRGYCSNDWYLTSSQFGSELWVGGAGFTVSAYQEKLA